MLGTTDSGTPSLPKRPGYSRAGFLGETEIASRWLSASTSRLLAPGSSSNNSSCASKTFRCPGRISRSISSSSEEVKTLEELDDGVRACEQELECAVPLTMRYQ